MTEEELEFHYFKLHDYDNNNKLDGVEIVKAITHFHAGKKYCIYDRSFKVLYSLGINTVSGGKNLFLREVNSCLFLKKAI